MIYNEYLGSVVFKEYRYNLTITEKWNREEIGHCGWLSFFSFNNDT